jgi:hypothetical protein
VGIDSGGGIKLLLLSLLLLNGSGNLTFLFKESGGMMIVSDGTGFIP